jgi:leader peptidase (prepilin peptidase)/N-methyltransferase
MPDLATAPLLTGLIGALAALTGAAVGSFIGTALVRLPAERSVISGRSACDGCGRQLGARELIPVLSWLALRGRCRSCGARIGGWQFGCEVSGAAIALAAVLLLAPVDLALAAMVLGWQLLLLGLLDLKHLWLPQALTALLALSGAAWRGWQAWQASDPAPLVEGAAGGALGFALLWGVACAYRWWRRIDGMGGGDPPLLGAIGVWVGPAGVIAVIAWGSIGGLAVALALYWAGRALARDTALPLGTMLAAAAWPVFVIGLY